MQNTVTMYDKFVDEYTSEDAVRKYTTASAGYGISYLLRKDYARIYLDVVSAYLGTPDGQPLRLLEFGCGAGMNITRLTSLLDQSGIPIESAYGTDFSPRLVQAAEREAAAFLPAQLLGKLRFHVARNEQLLHDLTARLNKPADEVVGSFDLIIAVNTFRYSHRFGKQMDCAADVFQLLRPGGVCVVIDMNDRFPAFRSRLKGMDQGPVECYLPSLKEYALPFQVQGFDIVKKGNFCWIPHSAGRGLTLCCRFIAPVLNTVARSRAMRSLVIARKPA